MDLVRVGDYLNKVLGSAVYQLYAFLAGFIDQDKLVPFAGPVYAANRLGACNQLADWFREVVAAVPYRAENNTAARLAVLECNNHLITGLREVGHSLARSCHNRRQAAPPRFDVVTQCGKLDPDTTQVIRVVIVRHDAGHQAARRHVLLGANLIPTTAAILRLENVYDAGIPGSAVA